jgi:hypothetical protein
MENACVREPTDTSRRDSLISAFSLKHDRLPKIFIRADEEERNVSPKGFKN